MTEQGYRKTTEFFRRHGRLCGLLCFVYKYLSYPVFAAYPLLLVYLFFCYGIMSGEFLRVLLVPAFVFLSVTLFRKLYNAERPYQKYNFEPLIVRDKQGQSFPSRHAASIFVIAMAFLYVNAYAGAALLITGVVMCVTRVLCGVHFIKDVAAGAAFAVLCGMIMFI